MQSIHLESIVLLTCDMHRSFICLLPWSIMYSEDSAHYWEQSSNQPASQLAGTGVISVSLSLSLNLVSFRGGLVPLSLRVVSLANSVRVCLRTCFTVIVSCLVFRLIVL